MAALNLLPGEIPQEVPKNPDEHALAGLDIIPRKLLEASPKIGDDLYRALQSLIQKGTRAREGARDMNPDKYYPNREFNAYRLDDLEGPTHYRSGLENAPGFKRRDYGRMLGTNESPFAGDRYMDPWKARSSPGGSTLNLSDAESLSKYPAFRNYVAETPAARLEPLRGKGGKYYTYQDEGGLKGPIEFSGNKGEVQSLLNRQGRGDLSEDWQGAVEEFSFPNASLSGTSMPSNNPLTSLANRLQSGDTSWMQDALSVLTKKYPEIPVSTLRKELQRAPLARLADKPGYKKEFDYRYWTPDEKLIEDAIKAYVDKGEVSK